MSKKRQALHFQLMRSGQISCKLLGVLNYLNSYSTYCEPYKLERMAVRLQISTRTLQRYLKKLIAMGLIKRSYRAYKRLHIEIVTLEEQAKLIGFGMVTKVIENGRKLRRAIYTTVVSHSIQNKTFNTIEIKNDLKKVIQKQSYDEKRREMLQRFYEHQSLNI